MTNFNVVSISSSLKIYGNYINFFISNKVIKNYFDVNIRIFFARVCRTSKRLKIVSIFLQNFRKARLGHFNNDIHPMLNFSIFSPKYFISKIILFQFKTIFYNTADSPNWNNIRFPYSYKISAIEQNRKCTSKRIVLEGLDENPTHIIYTYLKSANARIAPHPFADICESCATLMGVGSEPFNNASGDSIYVPGRGARFLIKTRQIRIKNIWAEARGGQGPFFPPKKPDLALISGR